jgi:hypothetical protein
VRNEFRRWLKRHLREWPEGKSRKGFSFGVLSETAGARRKATLNPSGPAQTGIDRISGESPEFGSNHLGRLGLGTGLWSADPFPPVSADGRGPAR